MQQELTYPSDFNAEVQASTSELYKSVSKIKTLSDKIIKYP